jgi:hypothetical protein
MGQSNTQLRLLSGMGCGSMEVVFEWQIEEAVRDCLDHEPVFDGPKRR